MSVSMTSRRAFFVLAASSLLLFACSKPSVESYRVPKESEPQNAAKTAAAAPAQSAPATPPPGAAAPQGAMANTAVATAAGPGLTWTAPATWATKQGAAMRKATYIIKSAGIDGEGELAITAFPGDVGGELANVNRWRGQVSLAPVSQADLGSSVTRLERNGLKIAVVDLVGGGQRMLGAIVPHAGATWFFKLLGPDALVAKEKPAFMSFLETVKPAGAP
jgi:hypothetical protein